MPRAMSRFKTYRRKDTKKFMITITPVSGLPLNICKEWTRVSFSRFPIELAHLREPKSKSAADNAADVLIEFLKKQISSGQRVAPKDITVGDWLNKFISLDDNPRSAVLISEGLPYSPDTIEGYRIKFDLYLKEDPFMKFSMASVVETDLLAFIGRLGLKKNHKGTKVIVGTRTFETLLSFLRMAFNMYEDANHGWFNPFRNIKAPKGRKAVKRDALTQDELIALFQPNVLTDPLQKAVCAAMFYAGLRRSEIFALQPDDLDWKTPRIKVLHAWKRFASKNREMGDPKCHKTRETIFPLQLQEAIKELWEAYGKYEFVFCRKDGSVPGPRYLPYWVPRWLKKAGINTEGRNIVPHSSRHSLASILENDGVPLRYIQKMLGHSRMETTLGYLHEPANTMNKISKKVSEKAQQPELSLENKMFKVV